MQALALIATWAAGLMLIGTSFYVTQMPWKQQQQQQQQQQRESSFRVTIYAAPRPFEGLRGQRQALAIHSWLTLIPSPCVVLMGLHASLSELVADLGPDHCVSVDSDLDFSFLGTPMFHSMVARARAATSQVAVLVEPDLVLLPDFMDVLRGVSELKHDWLLVATSRNVSEFPFYLSRPGGRWFRQTGHPATLQEVQDYVEGNARWADCKGVQLWAWNAGPVPLHAGVLPSFAYGAGYHNEWLLNEALTSNLRFVIDASAAGSIFRPDTLMNGAVDKADSPRPWEADGNAHLSATYGSNYFKPPGFSNMPAKLVPCGSKLCFLSARSRPGNCALVQLSSLIEKQDSTDQQPGGSYKTMFRRYKAQGGHILSEHARRQKWLLDVFKNVIKGGGSEIFNCSERQKPLLDCPSNQVAPPRLKPNLSMDYQLESLLLEVAPPEKVVVLTVVGNNYREMLMSWVCRLRHLNVSNYLVSAVDEEVYQFGILQGLPVFKAGSAVDTDSKDCTFGSNCFNKLTKLKSRTVLQILELGYHVLFSDVDIYWFSNPIRELMSFGPGTLAAQTDAYNETEPLNLPRRLNSGFYFAWSDNSTIRAFRKIVKHAARTKLSEQPSFYDVLCGEGGRHRRGVNMCIEPETNLTVQFLDRLRYPNGAYKLIWESHDVKATCKQYGCVVLHNNWKTGGQQKVERQMKTGLWDYGAGSRMCVRSWQNPNSLHLY